MGGSFAYPLMRDYLPSSVFMEIWLRIMLPRSPTEPSDYLKTQCMGLNFKSPIGAEAGVDVNCISKSKLFNLGLGFVEFGPVTPTAENTVSSFLKINAQEVTQIAPLRNLGGTWVKRQLLLNHSGPRGISLSALDENIAGVPHLTDEDFLSLIMTLYPVSDYLTINLCSSPFRKINYYSKPYRYQALLNKVSEYRDQEMGLQTAYETHLINFIEEKARRLYTPVLVKVNENWPDLEGLVQACIKFGFDGIIVGSEKQDSEISRKMLEKVYKASNGKLTIISYGGINNGKEALERIKLGAGLVQIYHILLTEGPSGAKRIEQELVEEMKKEGFRNVNEAVGAYYNKAE
jgi:dihydroorotate dehydrogenase